MMVGLFLDSLITKCPKPYIFFFLCSWRDPVSRSVYVIMAARSFIALTGTPDKSSSSGARTKTMLLIHFTGLQRSRAQTSIPLSASVMSHLGKLVVNTRGGGERDGKPGALEGSGREGGKTTGGGPEAAEQQRCTNPDASRNIQTHQTRG